MHLAPVGFLKKRKISLPSCIRNTSCSSGWLRLVVQIIFGTLIVTSFILIVLMALGGSRREATPNSRCTISNCMVVCNEAPFYGDHEDDIINAASEVDIICQSIALHLNRPTFKDSKIPENWLSRIRSNVRELSINGGNIKHISPYAFLSPLSNNLRILILENIEINFWDSTMLIGLSNLKKFVIKDCILADIRNNALECVSNSIEVLDIKANNRFDPTNLTGTTEFDKLSIVDFSSNNFNNILEKASFYELQHCKVLFLNRCKITAIGPGTFDYLDSIEVLYLNDNYLVTIPVGLFRNIMPLRPMIALQNNYWQCECTNNDLRTIFNKGLLIVDPICHHPDVANGLSFSNFEAHCNNIDNQVVNQEAIPDLPDMKNCPCQNVSKIIYLNGVCSKDNSTSFSVSMKLVPVEQRMCFLNRINRNDFTANTQRTTETGTDTEFIASFEIDSSLISPVWIKPKLSIQSERYYIVEMVSSLERGLGLVWYQSLCQSEIYCTNTIPSVIMLFDIDSHTHYTFCPFNLSTSMILNHKCLSYNLENVGRNLAYANSLKVIILYICISLGCLICGAISVYALIQRNPSLLKGNKRVVLVKHKSIEALVLPPQFPIRNKLLGQTKLSTKHATENKNIFLLPGNLDTAPRNFIRPMSIKSSASSDASYISALKPSEDQLNEWRLNQIAKQYDKTPTSEIDMSTFSSINDRESLPYYSILTSERLYEVPK